MARIGYERGSSDRQKTDGQRRLALTGIDRAQTGKRIRIIAAGGSDRLVRYPGPAHRGLGVPRQQHRLHPQPAVAGREVTQRLPLHAGTEVRLGRLDVARHAAVQPVRGGQVHMEVDRAWHRPNLSRLIPWLSR